jgi:hypothetical protein
MAQGERNADRLVACFERLTAERGVPAYALDHEPEFIAYATRDECRFTGTHTVLIDRTVLGRTLDRFALRRPARRVLGHPVVRFPARSKALFED